MPDVEMLKQIVAENIHNIRKSKGMSQRRLEELSGVDLRHIQRAEKIDSPINLSLEVLVKIANALEVMPSALLESPKLSLLPPKAQLSPTEAIDLAVSILKRYQSSLE